MPYTISGTLVRPDGSVFADTAVVFRPASEVPTVSAGNNVIVPVDVEDLTDENGALSGTVGLLTGTYNVSVDGKHSFQIEIPSDSGSGNIKDLIVQQA